jgi:hypothetical protein
MQVSSSLAGSSTPALTTASHDDLEGARCVAPASSPESTRTTPSPVPSPSLREDTSVANTSCPSSPALPLHYMPPSLPPPPHVRAVDAHARPTPASTPSSGSTNFGTLPLGPPQRHQRGTSMAPRDPPDPRWGIHGAHRRRCPCPLPTASPRAIMPNPHLGLPSRTTSAASILLPFDHLSCSPTSVPWAKPTISTHDAFACLLP